MTRTNLLAIPAIVAMSFALLPSAAAQSVGSQSVTAGELKDLLVQITGLLDRQHGQTGKVDELRRRIASLDPQAFDRLYRSSNNWDQLKIAVELMQKGSDARSRAGTTTRFAQSGGDVDAAEIQAGYRNTVAIYKNLDAHHLALAAHNTDLNNINTAIQFLINKHDGDMKAAVSKHDAEIKLLLATIKAIVDGNTQQLKVVQTMDAQVIRLLLMPDGQRAINPLVMTCTGDSCPKILDCPGKECSFPVK